MIRKNSISYTVICNILYYSGRDRLHRKTLEHDEACLVLQECHEDVCWGDFAKDATTIKVLMTGYHWPTLFKDSVEFCKTCPSC